MSNLFKKLNFLVVFTLALSACGGGDGSKSPISNVTALTPYSFSLSQVDVTADESTTIEISITESGAITPSYAVEIDNEVATATITNSKLVIDIGEVDRNSAAKIKVTATQGAAIKTAEVTLSISNVSATELIANVTSFVLAESAFTNLGDEEQVFEFLTDLAFRSGNLTKSAAITAKNQYAAAISGSQVSLSNVFSSLSTTLDEYQSGSISDSKLQVEYNTAMSLVNVHGKVAIDQINVATSSLDVVREIPGNGFFYNESMSDYSQFIGNTDIGSANADGWNFNSEYKYLDRLLATVNGLGNVCTIAE